MSDEISSVLSQRILEAHDNLITDHEMKISHLEAALEAHKREFDQYAGKVNLILNKKEEKNMLETTAKFQAIYQGQPIDELKAQMEEIKKENEELRKYIDMIMCNHKFVIQELKDRFAKIEKDIEDKFVDYYHDICDKENDD